MEKKARALLQLILLMLILLQSVECIWLNLPKSGRKCVTEEIHNNVVVLADYVVISDVHIHPTPSITTKVTSPYGNILHHKENATHGQFAFTTNEAGQYLVCFWADDPNQGGALSVNIDWKTGIAAKDWESVARKEKIEGVELELRKLEGAVEAIHDNLLYLKGREAEIRQVSETTNSRVAWYSILSLVKQNSKDSWKWALNSNGNFEVKILHNTLDMAMFFEGESHLNYQWNNLVPKKVEIFMWRLLQNRIPVREALKDRGLDLHSVLCPCCNLQVESVVHCLVECEFSKKVWRLIFDWWGLKCVIPLSIQEIIETEDRSILLTKSNLVWKALTWISFYILWKNRNATVFEGRSVSSRIVFAEIQVLAFSWISSRSRGKITSWNLWESNPIQTSLQM